ncbi:MAG: aminopeptidase [Candidatus Nanoarchaeia archaeon]|nr:aminopeptidase [Candidatus Nanoarchaeia archaeon]
MDLVQKAAFNVLRSVYKLKEGETFVAVSDYNNKFFSDALIEACIEMKAYAKIFFLDSYGKRPMKCPDIILEALSTADAGVLCATEVEGETEHFRRPFFDTIKDYNVRFMSMTGINKEAIEIGLNVDFGKVAEFTDEVYERIKNCRQINVKTELGTNLEINCGKYRWVNCSGRINPCIKDDNLPEGEVFTCPEDINGLLIVDGVLGDVFDLKYGAITRTPLELRIEKGYAMPDSFFCHNKALQNDILSYLFSGHNFASRVGEVALGTNICLDRIIGNLLQDEKYPSFHLAFGYPYPIDTGAEWTCPKHLDMVVLKPDVYVDGNLIMEKGKYRI